MSFNPNVALVNKDCQASNISLRFIQTLQEAVSKSDGDILYTNDHRPVNVNLTINIVDEKVNIEYSESKDIIESVSLKDYQYILGVLIYS